MDLHENLLAFLVVTLNVTFLLCSTTTHCLQVNSSLGFSGIGGGVPPLAPSPGTFAPESSPVKMPKVVRFFNLTNI